MRGTPQKGGQNFNFLTTHAIYMKFSEYADIKKR